MGNFDILESRVSTAQDIVYDADCAEDRVGTLVADLNAYYYQTGMLSAKPYETAYKISRIARQAVHGAAGHYVLPTFMRATLEGQDEALPLEHVTTGQLAREQYGESHPRMRFYNEIGEIVSGTATRQSVSPSTDPELLDVEEHTVTALCGASEKELASGGLRHIWQVFSDIHTLHNTSWLNWKKYDASSQGEKPHLSQVEQKEGWLCSLTANTKLIVGLSAWHQVSQNNSEPGMLLSHAAFGKRDSRLSKLALSAVDAVHNPKASVCPVEARTLQTLLERNKHGSGLCGGRLELKPHPHYNALCKEFAEFTGYPLAVDTGFSIIDATLAYVFKKLQTLRQ